MDFKILWVIKHVKLNIFCLLGIQMGEFFESDFNKLPNLPHSQEDKNLFEKFPVHQKHMFIILSDLHVIPLF